MCAVASRHPHWRDPKRSPMASAIWRPSSADARNAIVVTGDQRGLSLLAENLGQPPLVPQRSGQADRLGEVSRRHLGVVDSGAAAGGECPGQQRRIVEFARDRESLLRRHSML